MIRKSFLAPILMLALSAPAMKLLALDSIPPRNSIRNSFKLDLQYLQSILYQDDYFDLFLKNYRESSSECKRGAETCVVYTTPQVWYDTEINDVYARRLPAVFSGTPNDLIALGVDSIELREMGPPDMYEISFPIRHLDTIRSDPRTDHLGITHVEIQSPEPILRPSEPVHQQKSSESDCQLNLLLDTAYLSIDSTSFWPERVSLQYVSIVPCNDVQKLARTAALVTAIDLSITERTGYLAFPVYAKGGVHRIRIKNTITDKVLTTLNPVFIGPGDTISVHQSK